jgi:prolyl-tRNA synthetase
MRWSQYFIRTLKEVPSDAEAPSHIFLSRAGYIRKLFAGAYSYLPMGLRVLKKIEGIVRAEMDRIGGQEVLLPALHPAEIWKESGRFSQIGEDMFHIKDRKDRLLVLGPTHEEIITDLVRHEIRSYKEVPLLLYQIQTKFRDEVRPRFGIIRSKEFMMKDAYSFHTDEADLDKMYDRVYQAYQAIFARLGVRILAVQADPGVMGGTSSHEFMALSKSGENHIAMCSACDYVASLDVVSFGASTKKRGASEAVELEEVPTPGAKTIEEVSRFLKIKPQGLVKTLIYNTDQGPIAALVRGDHEINEIKLARKCGFQKLVLATPEEIKKWTGGPLGFSGPVGLKNVKIIEDYAVSELAHFVTGANCQDLHLKGVSSSRDYQPDKVDDIRTVVMGDSCPKCQKALKIETAMELGHIFKLMTKYSASMQANVLDEKGKERPLIMGCYGLGINRILAAIVELSHDKNGIKWPPSVSPFQILIVPVNISDPLIQKTAEEIYTLFRNRGVEVLLDDRNERAGAKFKDADLIGITTQIVIGPAALKEGKIEVKSRLGGSVQRIEKDELLTHLGIDKEASQR